MASSLYSGFSKAKSVTRAAVLAGATVAFALGATGAVQPAFADPLPKECASLKGEAAQDKCAISFYKRGIAEAKARGASAGARAAAADAIIACVAKLKVYKEKDPEGFKKLGLITRENACPLADEIGKRAALSPTAG